MNNRNLVSFAQGLSNDQLVDLFLQGEAEAFGVLISRHTDVVKSKIQSFVGYNDEQLINDHTQEIFIKAMGKIRCGKYAEKNNFKAWLLAVAHNYCIDYSRKKKHFFAEVNEDYVSNVHCKEKNVEEKLVSKEWAHIINSAIDRLPEKQRDVLIMHIFGNLKFRDIAKITSSNLNTTLGHKRYAVATLKNMLRVMPVQ